MFVGGRIFIEFIVIGVGLNLNALPMNPALVAAALNQWGMLGNINQNQTQEQVSTTCLVLNSVMSFCKN